MVNFDERNVYYHKFNKCVQIKNKHSMKFSVFDIYRLSHNSCMNMNINEWIWYDNNNNDNN